MFGRARLTLTAWYVGALVLTVASIGAITYGLLRDDLEREIDQSLRAAARELSATGALALPTATPSAGAPPADDDEDEHDEDEHETDDERLRLISSDVFYALLDDAGMSFRTPGAWTFAVSTSPRWSTAWRDRATSAAKTRTTACSSWTSTMGHSW
ncbi:hypothetical protein [Candidatus Amarobacter glycogenicus]|uniref:hypothetical protein n=1 Tax=Candidatus Amarobacter glycogenicus TaxID=3140699 RepID=UPI0031CCAE89